MKIHIICDRTDSTRIIPRLFTSLAEQAKFTIGETPDDKADINYFSLYLLYPKEGYTKTKTAALFSHYEHNVPSKAKEWERVAKAVDLRLTWTEKYKAILKQYGQTEIVLIGLDRGKFNFE